MIRLYVSENLSDKATVCLSEEQVHYLYHVMRRSVMDEVAVFNGRDGEWVAQICELTKKRGALTVVKKIREQECTKGAVLAVALIKKDNFDLILQKATELGVREIIPLMTARTVVSKLNIERAQHIVKEASEQCERLDVPEVTQPMTLKAFLTSRMTHTIVYLSERGQQSMKMPREPDVCFVIGPEGGWTPEEIQIFEQSERAIPLNLGRLILRAETAAIGILAAHRFDIFA